MCNMDAKDGASLSISTRYVIKEYDTRLPVSVTVRDPDVNRSGFPTNYDDDGDSGAPRRQFREKGFGPAASAAGLGVRPLPQDGAIQLSKT